MLDCVIIGGGPAGITAAIQLKRSGFNITLFEKEKIGGLMHNANLIENYLGFPHGITGEELCFLFTKHLQGYNVECKNEFVTKINIDNTFFTVITKNNEYKTRTVLFATGTVPISIDSSIINSDIKNDIYYEIKELLTKIKENQHCCILGGGDAAFDYALNLSKKKIYSIILFRSHKPTCLPLLLKRCTKNEYITIMPNVNIKKISKTQNKLVDIMYIIGDKKYNIQSNFLLVAYGRKINDFLFSSYHEKDNIPGFYFAGDVKTGKYRQIGIAVGQGLETAMKIEKYLRSKVL